MLGPHRRSLLDLFARALSIHASARAGASECLELQELLIKRITSAERQIRIARMAVKDVKRILGTRRTPQLSKKESQDLNLNPAM